MIASPRLSSSFKLKTMLIASFYIVFLVLSSLTPDARCSSETNVPKLDDSSSQSHDWLLFSVDESHYLNAARVGSSTVYDNFDCTLKCLRNPFCLSINLAASKDANGKLWCELLSSDRHRNPLDYRENKTSHHLFVLKNRFIYHKNMTPSWLEAHASYIDRDRSKKTEQLTFNAVSPANAALLKVPIMPPGILEDSSLAIVKIVVSLDDDIGKKEDSDPRFGVSDGVSFIGFETLDKASYTGGYAPCFGIEGTSGNSLGGRHLISPFSPRPSDYFYDGQFVITFKLNERWGSCYTAHYGGFVKTADYNKRLLLSKGLTLEVYKDQEMERVGIKFIEVTVM